MIFHAHKIIPVPIVIPTTNEEDIVYRPMRKPAVTVRELKKPRWGNTSKVSCVYIIIMCMCIILLGYLHYIEHKHNKIIYKNTCIL